MSFFEEFDGRCKSCNERLLITDIDDTLNESALSGEYRTIAAKRLNEATRKGTMVVYFTKRPGIIRESTIAELQQSGFPNPENVTMSADKKAIIDDAIASGKDLIVIDNDRKVIDHARQEGAESYLITKREDWYKVKV